MTFLYKKKSLLAIAFLIVFVSFYNNAEALFEQEDYDSDGVPDIYDNCPTIFQIYQSDTDGDGVGDACDDFPNDGNYTFDFDGDGLPYAWEQLYFTNLNETARGDPDGDGLVNIKEYVSGTNPNIPDSDNDGLTDGEEFGIYNTSPTNPDTDRDGLADGIEVSYWGADWNANPDGDEFVNLLDSDSDNDGLSDGIEVNINGTNPALTDTDGNGTSDGNEDFDLDGLTNSGEAQCGSNPMNPDSKCVKFFLFLLLLLD